MSLPDSAPPHSQPGRERALPWAVALLVGLALAAATFYVEQVERGLAVEKLRTDATVVASTMRARLESEINATLHLCLGLVAYVGVHPELSDDDFVRMAVQLTGYGPSIRAIALAPDNVVAHVYPLAGNEAVLGLRYLDNPAQREAVLRTIATRRPVVAGPVDLVQGGRGFINRVPIFVRDPSSELERYWGLASIVLDADALLRAGGLAEPPKGVQVALRGQNGLGARGGAIHGDPALFDRDPVILDVTLPGDARWQLATLPVGGWEDAARMQRFLGYRAGGLALALILAGLVFLWISNAQALRRRDAELQLAASVFQSASEGIVITDRENRIVSVNGAFTRLTGYSPEEVRGRNPRILSAGRTPTQQYAALWKALAETGVWQGEVWDRRRDGTIYPKWLTISVVRDRAGEVSHYVGIFSDISEQKAREAQIRHLAHHDTLTGLPNRLALRELLEQSVASAARHQRQLAVMFIDMDRFKFINDTHGHPVGDGLLMEVAHRLKGGVRASDVVARWGGDEFVAVVMEVEETAAAALVADKLLAALGEPYVIDGHELRSTPSIGISLFPGDGDNADTLLKNADTAMYHAKARGRNTYRFFTEKLNAAVAERTLLEHRLRQALAQRQFLLHYQPQVDLATGRVEGVEALLRWQPPDEALLLPESFVSVAEEAGLIVPLAEWMLREACRQLCAWRADGILEIRMAINLWAGQFQAGRLAAQMAALLHEFALPPGRLELEVTESAAMEESEATDETLRALKEMGIRLAIDDFGTGCSSPGRLKRLAPDRIKIHRSFVQDIETSPDAAAVCSAMVGMAHRLRLSVIAEGIDNSAQRNHLRQLGCDAGQGDLFSPPLAAGDATRFLQRIAERL